MNKELIEEIINLLNVCLICNKFDTKENQNRAKKIIKELDNELNLQENK